MLNKITFTIFLLLQACQAGSFFLRGSRLRAVDSDATAETQALFKNLHNIAFNQKSFIFGQEAANSFTLSSYLQRGVWGLNTNSYKTDLNDVLYSSKNYHPGVLEYDIASIIHNSGNCIDGKCEPDIHKDALKTAYTTGFTQGGSGAVISLVWHMIGWDSNAGYTPSAGNEWLAYNIVHDKGGARNWLYSQLDQAITFINSLKDGNNHKIPVIVRLYHEMNGNWFWWSCGDMNKTHISYSDFITLYRLTVDYFKPRVDNVLFAWSPDKTVGLPDYDSTYAYPGDSYVDIIGVDAYEVGENWYSISTFRTQLGKMVDFSYKHGKIPAITETGYRTNVGTVKDKEWASSSYWTDRLLKALRDDPQGKAFKIAYMLTWLNCGWEYNSGNEYVPFSHSSDSSKSAMRAFRDDPMTVFSGDLPNLYK